ncbi:MotA/TolQ/ExbB proton channel family protein [bacterium]|nr:MotA/TolQ/ExbB proton channel family protein [bacterium]
MEITHLMKVLGASGGEWVLYLLIAFSMFSFTLIIERIAYFFGNRERTDEVLAEGIAALSNGDLGLAAKKAKGPVGRMFQTASEAWNLGPHRLQAALLAHRLQEKAAAERGLVYLGTLGNNSPFVGLFGTVLGIIKAFKDLATASSQGPSVVMAGISEALIATAVGIMVAIPAVMAFNLFQRKIRVQDYRLEEAAEAIRALAADPALMAGGQHARR